MSFIGVILSGGQSSRMGEDKSQLNLHGQTMLNRTRDLLFQAGAQKVLISRNANEKDTIADIYPALGPLSGIHAVCSQYPEQQLLFVPVDLPLMSAQALRSLACAGTTSPCLARFEGSNLPLSIKVCHEVINVLARQLRLKRLSVGRFCQLFALLELPMPDGLALFNANTKEQWLFALDNLKAEENRTLGQSTMNSGQHNSSISEGVRQ